MRKQISRLAGIAAAFCLAAHAANAADLLDVNPQGGTVFGSSAIRHANNQIELRATDTDFNYLETGDPVFNLPGPLDEERGWVPGLSLNFSEMQDVGVRNLYIDAELSWSRGHTKYIGAPIGTTGAFGSIISRSGAQVLDSNFRFGEGFDVGSNGMLTPYFGIGSHSWNRGVNAGELYSHYYVGAGLMAQVSPFNATVLSAYGLIGTTLASHIKVAGDQTFPGFSSSLRNSVLYKFGASADYALTQQLHLMAGVDATAFTYGASTPVQLVGALANEPNSRTFTTTVNLGLGYGF
ncbi:MAG: hypothetical protein KGQ37_04990 [Hyphomicrobiales bacterium]|nr:hypothetical protein [Hyphomicrobiales bacterium]